MLRDILKGSTLVFVSNLIVNASAFLVLNLASIVFSIEEFAKLSFIFSLSSLLMIFLDLGFSNSLIPFFRKSQDQSLLLFSMLFRYALFLISIAILVVAYWYEFNLDYAFAIFLGAALNIWQGRKILYLAQLKHKDVFKNSLAYVFSRTLFALFALYLYGAVGIFSIFYWVLPAIFVELYRVRDTIENWHGSNLANVDFSSLVKYSGATYLSAIFFSTFLQISIFYANYNLDSAAVASIGAANIFLAMFALFGASLRSVLMPYVSEGYFKSSKEILKLYKYKILFFLIVGLAVIWIIHFGIYLVYSDKYTNAHTVFLILGIGQFFTIILGFYNLRIHEFRVPMFEAKINGLRLGIAVLIIFLMNPSLLELVIILSVVSVVFELLTSFYLYTRK